MSIFKKATRKQVRLRLAIDGPPGAGKTFTALRFATALAHQEGKKGRIAVLNTESGAIEKYLGLSPDGIPFDFDIVTLDEFAPSTYTNVIQAAGKEGYDVLIIDSLSHAWDGVGGALDQVSRKAKKDGNSYTAWKDVTPQHQALIESMLRSPCHVIGTMRSKMEYVLEMNEKGKMVPRKVGVKPVQREGMEYEFDIILDMDQDHIMTVAKSRCPEIDGKTEVKPGALFMSPVISWLEDGSSVDADHFAVTDSDLRTLNRHNKQAEKEAEKEANGGKPVDIREQMRRNAEAKKKAEAAVTEEATTTAKSPATNSAVDPSEDNNGFATALQAAHIRDLFKQLEIPDEDQTSILAKRNTSLPEELTAEQASELIDVLMGALKSRTAEAQESEKLQQEMQDQAAKEEKKKKKKKEDDEDAPF